MRNHSDIEKRLAAPRPARGTDLALGLILAAMLPAAAAVERGDRFGAEVVESACVACHVKGEDGAPRIGDEKAWAARAAQGLSALTAHALQGIRNMPAHGGNPGLSDLEIERAITHMVNASGGHWVEPLGSATPATMRGGEQVVQKHCSQCHREGLGGAPRIGDRSAWSQRMSVGLDKLVASAVHGHGGMPPRGGVSDLTDPEIRSSVLYMFNAGAVAAPSQPAAARPVSFSDPYHKVVDGAEVYLGIMRADSIPEASLPSNLPRGKGYYHLNLSLFDATSHVAIEDARIEMYVANMLGSETRLLEPIVANRMTSYGAFFRMAGSYPYTITAQIRRPGSDRTMNVSFEYRPSQ